MNACTNCGNLRLQNYIPIYKKEYKMRRQKNRIDCFDALCKQEEQIPRRFSATFTELEDERKGQVQVTLNNCERFGDVINDNAYVNDFYRYHDIFHFSFATLLGWSPCTRALMKRKRKSNQILDEIEDGARATITEEALSLIIFNEAKRKANFANAANVSKATLRVVKEMTENFEVSVRSSKDWEITILKAYEVFRFLISNRGGHVDFDLTAKEIHCGFNNHNNDNRNWQ